MSTPLFTAPSALTPWITLPASDESAGRWHDQIQGLALAAAGGVHTEGVSRFVTRACAMQLTECLPGAFMRFLFAPSIDLDPVLFTVVAVEAEGPSAETQRSLLAADDLGGFIGQVDDLRELSIDGYQLLRVDEEPLAASFESAFAPARVLMITLATIVRRRLPGIGEVDLYAVARGPQLATIAAAIVPVISLLNEWEFDTSSKGGSRT